MLGIISTEQIGVRCCVISTEQIRRNVTCIHPELTNRSELVRHIPPVVPDEEATKTPDVCMSAMLPARQSFQPQMSAVHRHA